MPLIRKPSIEELEDHFFGSGAFTFGWFDYSTINSGEHFPVLVVDISDEDKPQKWIVAEDFIEGIKKYAESLEDRSFDDLIEDMDAVDVDNVIQLIMFNEIRYS